MSEYHKSKGALFINNERMTDNHPHFTGYLDVSEEQLKDLVRLVKAGAEAKIRIGAWKSISQDKQTKYISLKSDTIFEAPQAKPKPVDDGWGDASDDFDDQVPF